MKNRLLSSLLTLAFLLGLCPVWQTPARAASVGTTDWSSLRSFKSGETYYISSLEDLKAFRDLINQDTFNTNGYGSTFLLTRDIVIHEPDCFVYNQQGHIQGKRTGAEVESWVPVGDYNDMYYKHRVFRGVFDGQGHTISGLYCYPDVKDNNAYATAGLFGWVDGTVRDLNVTNAYVYNRTGRIYAGNIAGGIAVEVLGAAAIENCTFDGFVYSSGCTGGIAAVALARSNIDRCENRGNVAGGCAGGIVSSGSGIVSNCVNRGNVTAISISGSGQAGGIAGSVGSDGAVYNCGSTGCIDGGSSLRGSVGGIAGHTSGPVENCWFAGTTGLAFKAAGIAMVSESLKPEADGDQTAPVQYCYSSYGTVALVFDYESSSAISSLTSDEGVNGCGKFYPYDVASAAAQTVVWTDQTGTEVREGQHPYLLSRQTDLVTALNGWAADHSGDYDLWALDERNLPTRVRGSWAESAQSPSVSGDVVTVSSAEELAGLAEAINGGADFSGVTVRLGGHIDLSSAYWTPIGTASNPFAGTFDSCGYRISGLRVRNGGANSGLFGCVAAGGKLVDVSLTDAAVQGGSAVGGIVGKLQGSIDHATFSGVVSGSSQVGGIAGTSVGTLLNCRNEGIVLGGSAAGGVAGSSSGSVENCFHTGQVTAQARAVSLLAAEDDYTGQVVGSGTAVNSYDAACVQNEAAARQLLAQLRSAAQSNEAYIDWTASAAANGEKPYYEGFSGGKGTADEPYLIVSVEQLAYLATLVNEGEDQTGVCYKLGADLVLNDGSFSADGQWLDGSGAVRAEQPVAWTPIGTAEHPFAGTLDGDGHILSGLYSPAGGLFGNLEGRVKNLLLAQGYVDAGDSAAVFGGSGTVINCGSTCTGAAGTLSGMDCTYRNCWDSETHPAVETLNRLGRGYNRWYEVPNSTDYAFSPSYVTLYYHLDGGTLADAPERCIYGSDLAGIGTPERTGCAFAGWKVYRVGEDKPLAVCVFELTREIVGDATELSLEAQWTDSGKTLLDYCDEIDGIYVLRQDVVLTSGVEVTAGQRLFLDTNGYDISAHAETALFHVTGGTLMLFNRSTTEDSTLVCNAAVFQKDSGELAASSYLVVSGQTILQRGAVDQDGKIVLREEYIAPVGGNVSFYRFRIDTVSNVLRLEPCNGEFSADLLPGETHYRYVRGVHLTPAELLTYIPNDWMAVEDGDCVAVAQYSADGRMLEVVLLGSSDIFVMDGIGCRADMDRVVLLRLSGTDFRPLAEPLVPRPDAGGTEAGEL